MVKSKKKIFTLIISILVLIIIAVLVIIKINNEPYSYKWVKIKESVINQQRLYVVSRSKKYVNGNVEITYLNDKVEKVTISKKGKLYVKSIIKKVKIIK